MMGLLLATGIVAVVLLLVVLTHHLRRPTNDLDRYLSALDRAIDEDTTPHVITRSPVGWRHGLGVPVERRDRESS